MTTVDFGCNYKYEYLAYLKSFPLEIYRETFPIFCHARALVDHFGFGEPERHQKFAGSFIRTIASVLFGYAYSWPVVYHRKTITIPVSELLIGEIQAQVFLETYGLQVQPPSNELHSYQRFTEVKTYLQDKLRDIVERSREFFEANRDKYCSKYYLVLTGLMLSFGSYSSKERLNSVTLQNLVNLLQTSQIARVDSLIFPQVHILHVSANFGSGAFLEKPCFERMKLTEPVGKIKIPSDSGFGDHEVYFVESKASFAKELEMTYKMVSV